MTENQSPEDIGAPVSYLVLKEGTPVYEPSGDRVGEVAHVLADEPADIFHGLILQTPDGHRFASGTQVDGLFEHGVILKVPAAGLPAPSADAAARVVDDGDLGNGLKRAWEWLTRPR